jgi:hypothetical protein
MSNLKLRYCDFEGGRFFLSYTHLRLVVF